MQVALFFCAIALIYFWLSTRSKMAKRREKKWYGDTEFSVRTSFSDGFFLDVVGENRYQRNLTKIAGGKKVESARKIVDVIVIPEPNNPFDKNAVRIDINELPVGYLSKNDALRYRERFGQQGARCHGVIVGGWDRGNGDTGSFGVRLDLEL